MLLHNRVNREELKQRMLLDTRPYTTLSFYRYYNISEPKLFRDNLYKEWSKLEVVGRIYIAVEGINAQIALPSERFEEFKQTLGAIDFLQDIRLNIAIEEKQKSFYKLDLKLRNKIVADGIEDKTFDPSNTGKYLDAKGWNEMLNQKEAVVIDMRNHYESEVGKFENARCPNVDTFKEELQEVIEEFEHNHDQKILMYCTGGIRCEKASAWMKHNGFNEVYHLEGGIINYVNQVRKENLPSRFHGVNFVFDQRLHERITDEVLATCHQCGEPADVHVNCANKACHLLFIQCATCAVKYEGCCGKTCQEVIQLPAAEQIELRKGKKADRIFSKGRFPHTQ